ncbi:hypothetical protein [Sphingomonas sp.]|uniref:hypothetical protein n=1 Tax=Sphingomonas sp. TaxID=28214 RepID=UPI002B66BF28|nr:hypothetical protein [Sphingomonas sp.]HTG37426.1 hypothetical protein [Sphingomonas sp.]
MLTMMMLMPLFAAQGDVTVGTREPALPTRQSQTFEAACGSTGIAIRDFGPARPDTTPTIRVDGAAARGSSGDVATFLAAPDAVYRFAVTCPAGRGAIDLRIYRARRDAGGRAGYAAMKVRIDNGAIVAANAESGLAADSFLFR